MSVEDVYREGVQINCKYLTGTV